MPEALLAAPRFALELAVAQAALKPRSSPWDPGAQRPERGGGSISDDEPSHSLQGHSYWEGMSDRALPGLSRRTQGAIAVLYTPLDGYVWRMLRSLCAHLAAPHPLILFWAEAPPSADARGALAQAVAGPGCHARQVWFVGITPDVWAGGGIARNAAPDGATEPNELAESATERFVSSEGGYRRMCWFWHRSVHFLPCLRDVSFVLRLDTDSEFITAPRTDPVAAVAAAGASYGYATFCFDNPRFTAGLWSHVRRWLGRTQRWAGGLRLPNASVCRDHFFDAPTACVRRVHGVCETSAAGDDGCPVPMFYTNFEVLRSEVFRNAEVDGWAQSLRRGVVRRRWGDAPLRALTVGMYIRPHEVVHLNDFAYRHGRGVASRIISDRNNLTIEWGHRMGRFSSESGYFLGICMAPPFEATEAPPPPTPKPPQYRPGYGLLSSAARLFGR